jgi:tetratricopeptide (TPR) repeat protein
MKITSNQAIQATLSGDWENAVALNQQLLADTPNDVEALNRMALAYTVLGKTKSAKTSYEKVLEIDPLNSIAIKNLRKIKEDCNDTDGDSITVIQVNNIFIEETGKTKVVDLINLAQAEILASLRTGQTVDMSVKRLKIFVLQGKKYIGVLPDDIGKRLIKFIKGGNKYEAYVKSATHQSVTIFIRELKKSSKFKDQPSFIHTIEKKFSFKNGKSKSYKEDPESSADEE